LLCTGAREAAFRNIKTIAECLADELINAAKVGTTHNLTNFDLGLILLTKLRLIVISVGQIWIQ